MSDHLIFSLSLIVLFFLIMQLTNHNRWKRKNQHKMSNLIAKKNGNHRSRISVVDIKAAIAASSHKDFE